ncbi:hypothetical protein A0128_00915 [Leptospira tipperaryensis]|uniref:Lipoprotein n=2 Tax=Leptospira tipperaryensis TaxID=2564040 RepID=A0A1D7USP9_9LEPT|nr:hypothetical protein A0128_00915 [Leptospira tipperaryensis]
MKFKKFNCLPALIMILIACQSQGNRVREQRNDECKGSFRSNGFSLVKPVETGGTPAIQINDEWYVTSKRYNAYRLHAKDLSRCLYREQCVRKWTEWERDCAEDRIKILESSLLPGIFSIRSSCVINQPVC